MGGRHVRGSDLEQPAHGETAVGADTGHNDSSSAVTLAEQPPRPPALGHYLGRRAATHPFNGDLREHPAPGKRGRTPEDRAKSCPRVGLDEISQALDEGGGLVAGHAVC